MELSLYASDSSVFPANRNSQAMAPAPGKWEHRVPPPPLQFFTQRIQHNGNRFLEHRLCLWSPVPCWFTPFRGLVSVHSLTVIARCNSAICMTTYLLVEKIPQSPVYVKVFLLKTAKCDILELFACGRCFGHQNRQIFVNSEVYQIIANEMYKITNSIVRIIFSFFPKNPFSFKTNINIKNNF